MMSFPPQLSPNVRRFSLAPQMFTVLLPVVLSAGCGVGDYESRMEQSIDRLKLENQFVTLRPPFAINPQSPNLVVTMRVPTLFQNLVVLSDGAALPDNPNEPMPDARLKPPPPLVAPPCYQVTLEQFGMSGAGQRPFYFYLGVVPVASKEEATTVRNKYAGDLELAVQGKVGAPAAVAWRLKNLPTPKASVTRPVWELQVDMTQLFEVKGNIASEIPGTLLLQAIEVPGHQVFIGWRVCSASLDYKQLLESARAAAGTIEVARGTAAPPPAQPAVNPFGS